MPRKGLGIGWGLQQKPIPFRGLGVSLAAANARIEGMKAKNAIRESEGYALAYDDEAFFIEAGFLEQLAHQVINQ